MAISIELLQIILKQQQEMFESSQRKLVECLTKSLSLQANPNNKTNAITASNSIIQYNVEQGREWLIRVCHFVQKQQLMQTDSKNLESQYPEIFQDDVGHCKIAQTSQMLKQGVIPTFRRKRTVPNALKHIINNMIGRLVLSNVLEPSHFAEWSAFIKKRNGIMRTCAVFSTKLITALETHQYQLLLLNEYFSKLNAVISDAHSQVLFDPGGHKGNN